MNLDALQLVRNDKKRRCTGCRAPMKDGRQVLVKIGADGKPKGYFCHDHCAAQSS